MGYSMNDLNNAADQLNKNMEKRAEQRGEELANRVLHNTSQGRGLWFIILWPAWFLIFVFSGSFFKVMLEHMFSMNEPMSWIGLIGGLAFAVAWYKWDYTIRHPFLGSMVGYFGTALGVLFLAEKLGW